jgi:hypothetical protein
MHFWIGTGVLRPNTKYTLPYVSLCIVDFVFVSKIMQKVPSKSGKKLFLNYVNIDIEKIWIFMLSLDLKGAQA